MGPLKYRTMTVAVIVATSFPTFDAQSQMRGLDATALEKAHLPKFCLKQMGVPDAIGPEYEFPRSCGPSMNHYCPGLVYLIRAKSAASKKKSIASLRTAEANTRYTENGLKDFPACPIRGHIENTKAEIQSLMTLYGVKPSGKK